MKGKLTLDDWHEIAHHWRIGSMPVPDIAKRFGIKRGTIYARAKKYVWQKRGEMRAEPQLASEALLADLTFELRRSLATLRAAAPDNDTPATAKERTALIREYRRSLALVIGRPSGASAHQDATPPLDIDQARRAFLGRFSRLDATDTAKDSDDPAPTSNGPLADAA